MTLEKSVASRIADIVIACLLIIFSLVMLYPMLYVVFSSFSDPAELIRHRGFLSGPLGFSTVGYSYVFNDPKILTGYLNTLFILIVGLVFNITLTSMGAYFLSRKNVYWYRPIMIFILVTMYFSGGLIPLFLTVRNLGMYNSLWALIIPTAINTYNMIVLRSYFNTIPDSLVESVHIDGGGHFTILVKIFIPLSIPAMAVMVLYYGVDHWISWFNAMIYISEPDTWPLQLVIRDVLMPPDNLDGLKNVGVQIPGYGTVQYAQVEETVKAAAIIVSTIPILFIYPFLQKYFVGGLMIGSLKE